MRFFSHLLNASRRGRDRMVVNLQLPMHISVISWRSVLLVEETGEPGENHRPVASQ
jgi:hypothetical protein